LVNLKLSIMNNGIKKKLEELIGKEVSIHSREDGIYIVYPSDSPLYTYKVLRVEDDSVMLGNNKSDRIISLHHISSIEVKKK